MSKFDIRSADQKEIGEFVAKLGEKPFRAKQIFQWLHGHGAFSLGEMTNLSHNFRQKIGENASLSRANIVQKQISYDKTTIKYLLELENSIIMNEKTCVESVLMHHHHGYSLCVSSQAGCRMGCAFCASAKSGFFRNLSAGEMAAQVYEISRDADVRISNIVIMGMGEPLDNYDNTLRFIKLISDSEGANISCRHITLSTCGITPKIMDLMEENLQITLAISLHAPNDTIRQKIMPIAKKYPMDELLAAAKTYAKLRRRITFEYAMIKGINDSVENALELAKRIKGIFCHVNLIGINEVDESDYKRSSDAAIARFSETLEDYGINVTIRRSLGDDIAAACGQLRMAKQKDRGVK